MCSCTLRDFCLYLFLIDYRVAMLVISSNIICTRNWPTVIICKAARGGILLFNDFRGSMPLDEIGGLAFISTCGIPSLQEQRVTAVSVLRLSADQGCCGDLGDGSSLYWETFGLGALLDKCESPLGCLILSCCWCHHYTMRDGGILLYYLEIVNISIVIISDDLMSLENYY